MPDQNPLDVEAIRARLDAATITEGRSIGAIQNGKKELRRHAPTDLRRLLDENARLNAELAEAANTITAPAKQLSEIGAMVGYPDPPGIADAVRAELAARDRTVEALSARLTAKNAELDHCIRASLAAGVEFAEKIGAMRAERDEALREASADKAKLAELPDLETIRRIEKERGTWGLRLGQIRAELSSHLSEATDPCVDHGSEWPCDVKQALAAAPEVPRPPAEEAPLEYRCPNCYRWALWTDGVVDGDDDGAEEFWCQTCGSQTPIEDMDSRPQEPVSGPETAGTGSGRGTGVTGAPEAQADLSLMPADLIKSDPGIRGGEPCITGTRIPAHEVAGYLADGLSWDEVREMLPSLPSLPVPSTADYRHEPEGA